MIRLPVLVTIAPAMPGAAESRVAIPWHKEKLRRLAALHSIARYDEILIRSVSVADHQQVQMEIDGVGQIQARHNPTVRIPERAFGRRVTKPIDLIQRRPIRIRARIRFMLLVITVPIHVEHRSVIDHLVNAGVLFIGLVKLP